MIKDRFRQSRLKGNTDESEKTAKDRPEGPEGLEEPDESELGGHMSFLEHLDEFRKRLVRSFFIVAVAFIFCWFFSDKIYNFLAIPGQRALREAQRIEVPLNGVSGKEKLLPINNLKLGDKGLYVFQKSASIGNVSVAAGTSILAKVEKDAQGNPGLFSEQPIFTSGAILPKGVKLPLEITMSPEGADPDGSIPNGDEVSDSNARMVITTAPEPFTLYVTVSLYAAIALSVPFLLLEIWGFVSPALYRHERKYVTPFILLSSISFVLGAAFAYYVLFPPAVKYLLGLGSDFQLLLRATDYFDFITLIMLAMGVIFQMPAVSYVLSRIGIINAGFLVRSWKIALIVILIVAAVVSPTGDIPNLMLFATPMTALYIVSILVAWMFGKERTAE